jgi:16S rRNA (guanine527-N7)-methyltransferase
MASHRAVRVELVEVCDRFGLPPETPSRFAALLASLADAPDPHTTVGPDSAVEVHIADSLSGLEVPELRSARVVADLGAGAGFPGLPLAIALPDARIDLIESARRKAAVITRLISAADVDNARVIACRAEEVAAAEGRERYDAVTARAVGPLAVLVEYAAPLLAVGGVLVAWKGARDSDEEGAGAVAAAETGLEPAEVVAVQPYPESRNRHLHVYRKTAATPGRFPRRPGMAAKRPLG